VANPSGNYCLRQGISEGAGYRYGLNLESTKLGSVYIHPSFLPSFHRAQVANKTQEPI